MGDPHGLQAVEVPFLADIETLDQEACGAVSCDAGIALDAYMVLKQAATSFPVLGSRAARKISM